MCDLNAQSPSAIDPGLLPTPGRELSGPSFDRFSAFDLAIQLGDQDIPTSQSPFKREIVEAALKNAPVTPGDIPVSDFDPAGGGFDFESLLQDPRFAEETRQMFREQEAGKDVHFFSRLPFTEEQQTELGVPGSGMFLKGQDHPTFFKSTLFDARLGADFFKTPSGRIISAVDFPDSEAAPENDSAAASLPGNVGKIANPFFPGTVSTELSLTVDLMDVTGDEADRGKFINIPSLTPDLKPLELGQVLSGKIDPKSDEALFVKAIESARSRIGAGEALPQAFNTVDEAVQAAEARSGSLTSKAASLPVKTVVNPSLVDPFSPASILQLDKLKNLVNLNPGRAL